MGVMGQALPRTEGFVSKGAPLYTRQIACPPGQVCIQHGCVACTVLTYIIHGDLGIVANTYLGGSDEERLLALPSERDRERALAIPSSIL